MSTRRLLVFLTIGLLGRVAAPAAAQQAPSLFADFTAVQTSGPLPLDVEFRDLSLGDPTSWEWDFGDHSEVSIEQHPIHRYERTGKYTVSLTVHNARGSDVETKYDYVAAGVPVAGFDAAPTSGALPLTVHFTDLSQGELLFHQWDFGDGGRSIVQHPTHTYGEPGVYTVTLTVSNSAGADTEAKPGYISVQPHAPAARFTTAPVSGATPLTVRFTDRSTNAPTSWHWDFGDGGTSAEQNPTHTYYAPGRYTVTLTARSLGGSDSVTEDLDLTAGPRLTADFAGSPTSGAAPLTVGFTDRSQGSPVSWRWDFGDLFTSPQRNPAHTYYRAGSYTVSLTVSDYRSSDTETKTDYIEVNESHSAPVADFTAWPTSGPAPLTVRFTDCSRNNPIAWSWDFGDGATSTERNPSHTYQRSGSYSVRLTVSNYGGRSSETKSISVTFVPPLAADFTASPTSGTVPLTVSFSDRSTGNPVTWRWDFGDGAGAYGPNQSHTYRNAGSYTVSLTVSNMVSSDTATESIQVNAPPPPAFP